MRGARLALVVLAAGTLALGTSAVFAAESAATTTAPTKPAATTGMSTEKAVAPKPAEAKESKAQQQKEAQAAKNREKENGVDRVVRGEVTHVETSANPPTLTVNVMRGKQAETVGVDVPAGAKIMAGKSMKSLADIKVGDRVWMRYDRTSDRLVADQIRILGMSKVAKTEKTKAYAKTTAAASKSGPATPAAMKSGTSK
ncbi:MAG TPA: hypothetical protein VLM91_19335 [Candidatus Methylomirabilis sp.]|nr:hypothetical protein [Candidatus Methylomirabilis sp.]